MIRHAKLAFLFICRWAGVFSIARRISRKRLNILCYHGFELVDETSFRPKLFIRSDVFRDRMALLRRRGYTVLPLDEALERLYRDTLPANSVVITIDDGFFSVLKCCAPILAQYRFPATLYATTYYVSKQRPIFRLVVQYIFWKTTAKAVVLQHGLAGCPVGKYDLTDASAKDALMWECIDFGEKRCSEDERRSVCVTLGEALDVSVQAIEESRILTLLTPEQLKELGKFGVSIELHTHRHRFPVADEGAAKREIDDNRAALSEWIPGEFRHFCYPSGVWDSRQWPWLHASGIVSATTCVPGLNDRRTPPYRLRRLLDAHCVHELEFEAALCGLTDILRSWIHPTSGMQAG